MATSYTGLRVQDTYNAIIKIGDNSNLSATPKLLSDGLGNDSPLYLSGTRLGIGITPAYQFHTSGNAKIGGNLIISGNLTVNGTLTYLNVEDLAVEDPIIKLAKDNTANTLDIGLFGKYVATGTKYKGFFNDASDDKFKLFIGTTVEPTTTVDTSASGYTVGTLVANLEGNVTGNADTATGVLITADSTDTSRRMVFTESNNATDTDGRLFKDSASNFFYNPSSNTLTLVNLTGTTGTFSGQVTIPETPTADGHAASKKYVDDQIADVDTAKRLEVDVKNVHGATLAKGTVVHAQPTGTLSGNVIEVVAADANTKMPSIGVLNEALLDDGEGKAVMFGTVQGIDTSGFSVGDELYVSATAGQFTATKPTATTEEVQKIAIVVKSHASNGLIKVFGAGRANDVPNRIDRNVNFTDSSLLSFGNGVDFYQYHDGTNSYIKNYTGDLIIEQNTNDKDIVFKSDNGSGGTTAYFQLDGSHTQSIAWKDIHFVDGVKAKFGDYANPDLEIYHDTGNSIIKDNGTGNLYLMGSSSIRLTNVDASEHYAKFIENGAVELYYDNSKKFETTSTGVTVTGNVTGSQAIFSSSTAPVIQSTSSSTAENILLIGTDTSAASAPDLVLYRNAGATADNDTLGVVEFRGRNDANTGVKSYSGIYSRIIDASENEGAITFSVNSGSNYVNAMAIHNTGTNQPKVIIGNTDAFAVPTHTLDVDGTLHVSGDATLGGDITTSGIIKTSDGTATTPAYNFSSHDGNGMYLEEYDATNNKEQVSISTDGVRRFRANEAGIWSDQNVYFAGNLRKFGEWLATSGTAGYGFKFQNTADSTTPLFLSSSGDATFAGSIKLEGPDGGEGISWLSGNLWKIYESPNDLSNAAGNLQFVKDSTRSMTLDTSGNLYTLGGLDAGSVTSRNTLSVTGVSTFTSRVDMTGTSGWNSPSYFYATYTHTTGMRMVGNESQIDLVSQDLGEHASSILLRGANQGFGLTNSITNNRLEIKYFVADDDSFTIHGSGTNVSTLTDVVFFNSDGSVDFTGDLDVAGDLTIGTNDLTAGTATIGGILLQDSSDRSGLLEINRLGSTGWTGIQIVHGSDLWSIMGNTSDFGIYHDVRSQWIMLHNDGGTTEFHHLGSKKLEVTSTGISVTGTVTGDVTGDLTGSVTGAASLNVLKAGDTMTGNLKFGDNDLVLLGAGDQFQIGHKETYSQIATYEGHLYLDNNATDSDIVFRSDDGSGGLVEYFRVDGSNSRVVYGRSIHMTDNVSIILGNADNGLIRYDSTAGRILQTGVTQFSTTIYAQGDIIQGSSSSKFTNGNYFEIGTGKSNTAQLTFNADYDGGETDTYTPHYAGAASAGMSVIKMPSGGVGGLDFYVKKHGTTSGSQALSTFTKILQLHQDGYSTFAGNVVIGSVDSVVTGLNIGEASPTIQLFDTTNDGKLLMYMQDSSAVIGTYSNHTLNLFSNSTLALTIDTSQRVGVGTSTPSDYYTGADNLVIYQASGEAGITVATATDTTGSLYFADGTTGNAEYRGGIFYNHNTDTFGLVSGGASRVTLDVNGNATFVGSVTATSFSGPLTGNVTGNLTGVASNLTVNANDTFSGTYPLLWHSGNVVYSSSFMTINGTTDTLNVPNISVTSGGLTVSGNSVVDKGTNIDRGDIIFEITEFDDTNSLRTKLGNSNTAITRVDDSTAPDGGCWQLADIYKAFTFEKFIKVHPGQEYIFETWIKFVSGTDTNQRLYMGASFYDGNKDYLGNSQRYWGESALQVDADSNNDGWYHTAGTLGPTQGSVTGNIPTAARWMKLIMLVNYSDNANTIRLCGTRCYHSGGIGKQMITSLYRKSIGSTVGSSAGDWVGTKVMDTSGNLFHPDNVKSYFGTGNDLEIYHDGSNSFITDSGAGNLIISSNFLTLSNAADTEYMAKLVENAQVELYYDGSKKLETTSTGVTITGNATVTENILVGQSNSTDNYVQVFHSDNAYTKIHGYGIITDRTNYYLRPVNDGTQILYIGGADASLDWSSIQVKFATDVDFSQNGALKLSVNSTGIYVAGTGTFTGNIDFSTNNSDISMKDSAGALTRVMVLNSSNTMYIGPVDSYAGGTINYGSATGVISHSFYTGGTSRVSITQNQITFDNNQYIQYNTDDQLVIHNGASSYINIHSNGNIYYDCTGVNYFYDPIQVIGYGSFSTANDAILTLNQTGTDTGWNYINWSYDGTRRWYTGLDSSKNFSIFNDNIDIVMISCGWSDNTVTVNSKFNVKDSFDIDLFTTDSTNSTGQLNLALAGAITFYGNSAYEHSITSRDNNFNIADDIRINSYGAVYINLDSNNNNTSLANFVIGRHGGVGTISTLFTVDGETGDVTITGDLNVSGSFDLTNLTVAEIYFDDANTKLEKGNGNSVRVQTNYGYLDLGPESTAYCHFITDRNDFYFNKTIVVAGSVEPYQNLSYNLGTSDLLWGTTYTRYLETNSTQSRTKIRVWSGTAYGIGMQSNYSFGGLNSDYAMTFQFNDDADRGFWWGDTIHTNAQGAMALTTNGKLTVAHSMRLAYGESDTTIPGATYELDVNGSAYFNEKVSIGNAQPSHMLDVYSATGSIFAGRFQYAGTTSTVGVLLLRLGGGSTAPSYVDFIYGSVQTGYITTNGSGTIYGTSSDYRLKENVVELTGALDKLDNLQPKRFNFITTPDQTVDGFLAHEVAEIVPEAIHGEKDAVDEDGNIKAQAIDQSKLVPLLVAAVQELRAEVKLLKSQINS